MPTLRKKRDQIIAFRDAYAEFLKIDLQRHASDVDIQRALQLRSIINKSVPLMTDFIRQIGQETSICYSPPPIIGGLAGDVDLLANIFNKNLRISPQNTLDMLDKAIGRYDYWISHWWRPWLNPLRWIGEIIRIPFYILRWAGFDGKKFELSLFGKGYKAVVGTVALIVGVIKIYEFAMPFLLKQGIVLP